MSGDLPEAQTADDVFDPNAKAQRKQKTIYIVGASVIALVGMFYLYSQFGATPDKKVADTKTRVLATADVARGEDADPGVAAGDLQRQMEQLRITNSDLATQNATTAAQLQQAQAQLAADRADAQNTIAALEDQNRTRNLQSPQPAGNGFVAVGGAPGGSPSIGAPLGAPSALTPSPGGYGAGGATPLPIERPRRSMSTVRVSAPAPKEPAAGSRLETPQGGSEFANKPGAAPGAGTPKGAGQANYFTGKLVSYETANYVPPNAYVTAKVLVGVDSAAGVAASADPKPVMFRLTGPAISVGSDGRYQSTDIRGCLVNGAAYGELSSEKVYIKLQRITCPLGNNKFSVATVEGYVSQRGKAGVRGKVVERAGGLTARAAVAGTLQGLGTSLSQNLNRSVGGLNSSAGASGLLSTEKLSGSEIAQGAVGGGVSNASSMLADYYIKRAEQYQPVIEMPTGISVEIVFLSGFQVRGE